MAAAHEIEKWTIAQIPSMNGKIVIVTGANSGIGYQTTLELARKDATVIMACRSEVRAQAAIDQIKQVVPTARVHFLELDLSSLESVESFAATFQKQYSHLDLLVNNAGVMFPSETHTSEGMESQFAVNHLGHFRLTQLLFPSLIQAPTFPSRIVNVSSVAHARAQLDFKTIVTSVRHKWLYMNEYSISKLCNLLFTYELHRHLVTNGKIRQVLSIAAHPGVAATDLAPKVVLAYCPRFLLKPILWLIHFFPFQSSHDGAIPILYAATAPTVESGAYYGPNGFKSLWGKYPKKITSSKQSYSKEDALTLWTVSEGLLKSKFTI